MSLAALLAPAAVEAQMTSGPGLSSGTGQGTGAGGRTGVLRNQSGSMSGVGPGPAATGTQGRYLAPPPGPAPRRNLVPFGPGVDVTFPDDPYLLPFTALEQPGAQTDKFIPTYVTTDVLKNARSIATANERSLALQRVANGAIAANQLTLAHKTLEEATSAASDVTVPLLRDQRLIALVTSLNLLTTALVREGHETLAPLERTPQPEPLPKRLSASDSIRMARLEWRRGVYLAQLIGNPTYRNEMLFRVAESAASGSASIANEYTKPIEIDTLVREPTTTNTPRKDEQTPRQAEERRRQRAAEVASFKKEADTILIDSFEIAKKIDRLILKYRAMVRIALLAADSEQYARGVELSRGIQNGEARSEAMLLLAESQCRHNQSQTATVAYEQAAQAVAAVQQEGLRGVLAGILIDSLIATGRFDDARACVVLYPDESSRLVALGAVAESQGMRGAAESARRWIANEMPAALRPALYRRVTTGILAAAETNRTGDLRMPEERRPVVP
jgi:hypothetical protein